VQVPLTQTAVIPPTPDPVAPGGGGSPMFTYPRRRNDDDDVAMILALIA
jgi:hypothetical protein